MKKITCFILLGFSFASAAYAGLSVGLPGAVQNQVNKLDDKVLAAIKRDSVPASSSEQAGNGTVEISWAAVSGASSYNIYWGTTQQLASMSKISRTASPYTLTGLTNGTVYYYAVASVVNGVESNLTTVAPIVPSAVPPLIPQNVSVLGYGQITATSGQTTVSWSPVPGASSYNIYWSDGTGVTKASTKISGATSPYTHTGLTYGQKYYYRVSALNAQAESVLSAETSNLAKAYTTVGRAIVPTAVPGTSPALLPYQIDQFAQYGYGVWQYGAGNAYVKKLNIMPSSYTAASSTNTATLLRFFTITDIHITDKESPAEAVYFGLSAHGIISAYSPAMLYTTHMLDAAVRTVNAIHKETPIDFGISLGDAANSTQYNELRWFIDVLDGKTINPSSGDHAGASVWDYQKPYRAAGLDREIPWYATLGNHDHFWVGSFPVSDKTRQAAVGSKMLNVGNIFANALGTASTGYYMGAIDGSTQYGTPTGAGAVENFTTPPTVVADPNRREMSRIQWMAEYFNTSSTPLGHGFSRSDMASGFANYTFMPKANLPIEVIVLDDTQRETDPSDGSTGPDWGHGSLDAARYSWLVNELDKGQAAGNLMIIAAHVPIGVSAPGALDGWSAVAAVTESDLIAKLKTYPNLLMWIAGHRHLDTITPMPSPDPSRPELGFWVVETRSLREYPQQFRTFRIDRNSDNTISIYVTNVDPIVDGLPAAAGRTNAIAAEQIFKGGHLAQSNAELVKQLTPGMQVKIRRYGTPIAN